jgi:transcription elongation factor GreA
MSSKQPTAELLDPVCDGEAEIGERITVLDLTTSAVHDYRLVEPDGEEVLEGEVSVRAPLGSALLGRHVGDVVSVEGDAQVIRLEVVEIDG